jgi:hypothetical protein
MLEVIEMPLPVMAAIIQRGAMKSCFVSAKKVPSLGNGSSRAGRLKMVKRLRNAWSVKSRKSLGITIEVEDIFQAVHSHYDHGDFLVIGYLARHVAGEITLRVHSACAVGRLEQ